MVFICRLLLVYKFELDSVTANTHLPHVLQPAHQESHCDPIFGLRFSFLRGHGRRYGWHFASWTSRCGQRAFLLPTRLDFASACGLFGAQLGCLAGDRAKLHSTCAEWGIQRKRDGKEVLVEE